MRVRTGNSFANFNRKLGQSSSKKGADDDSRTTRSSK